MQKNYPFDLLSLGYAIDAEGDVKQAEGLSLPKLPAPLHELNVRTLQSMIVGIAKDLKIDWNGKKTEYWPEEIPFINPRVPPPEFKGNTNYVTTNYIAIYKFVFLHVANSY